MLGWAVGKGWGVGEGGSGLDTEPLMTGGHGMP